MPHTPRRHAGFTLVELIAVVMLAAVALCCVAAYGSRSREVANRTICSSNLAGIYKALYTYTTTSRDKFPKYDHTPGGSAVGFREGDRHRGTGARLTDNVTAALWILVRDGSTGPKSYVCPDTMDEADNLTTSAAGSTPAILENTYDFLERKNLSYSMINMYGRTVGDQWTADVNPAWVIMADNNASDHPDRHTTTKHSAAGVTDIEKQENSPNHDYEGQNFLFGDSHVSFENDPYQGPNNDNVFALDADPDPATETAAPPTLAHDAINDANRKTDIMLLPVSGNLGVSISGEPMDVVSYAAVRAEQRRRRNTIYTGLTGLAVIAFLGWIIIRNRPRPAAEETD